MSSLGRFLGTFKYYPHVNPVGKIFLSPLVTDIVGCPCNNYFSPFFFSCWLSFTFFEYLPLLYNLGPSHVPIPQ